MDGLTSAKDVRLDTGELAEFRRNETPFEQTLRDMFRRLGAVSWGLQAMNERPWYAEPVRCESKLFVFFFLPDNREVGHYCVPFKVIMQHGAPRPWHDSFLNNVQRHGIDEVIPQETFDWRS